MSNPQKYSKHVFVCANQKAPGKKCCGEEHGLELVKLLKDKLKERGLHLEIRAQKSGCLDVCAQGPAMVVYPEGVFYGNVSTADIDEIVESHLVGNQVVERLQLFF